MTLDAQRKSPALAALAARGFIEHSTDLQAIDDLLAAGPVRFYIGFDPTAPALHVGSLVQIMAMRLLQRHGHQPIVLLGGGTARVGDPSGRSETRKLLRDATIDEHVAAIRRTFERFLDVESGAPNAAIVVNNATWLLQQGYVEFLRDIGVHFTVNRMIATKTYRERLDNEQPLSFLEFNYQLLQAYDFLHLYRSHQCAMQLGGSDQWANIVAGVELIRRVTGHPHGPAHCITIPLLTTADGRKMGKTERGAVWLDPELFSPFDYYQYFISCEDGDVRKLLLLFSDYAVEEIDEMCRVEGAALRAVKAKLAHAATELAHGHEAATRSAAAAAQAFGSGDDWSAVPAVEFGEAEVKLLDLVSDDRLATFSSKRQARQRIESGAVRIDGEVRRDPNLALRNADFEGGTLRLQAGKRCRFRIVLGRS